MEIGSTLSKVPRHLAIVMSCIEGYSAGNPWPVIEGCMEFGVGVLTLYAPSTKVQQPREYIEEAARPGAIGSLLVLLEEIIGGKAQKLYQDGIQLRYIGRLKGLPNSLARKIKEATELTKDNERLTLNIAFNYRGRTEILDAVRRMVEDDVDPDSLDEELFSRYLYTAGLPDPDLIVCTAGEMRFRGLFIWQGAYAEYYYTSTCWPDFDKEELYRALLAYSKRERRFGKLPKTPPEKHE